jgi:hypothetical protein
MQQVTVPSRNKSSRPKVGNGTPATSKTVVTGGAGRSGRPPPENPVGRVYVISAPPRPFKIRPLRPRTPLAARYRYAHLILESMSPDKRGGSERRPSMEAQTVDGGLDRRWLIFQIGTRVPTQKDRRNGRENFSARRRHECLLFLSGFFGLPPTCPRGYGRPRLGGKSRHKEWLRPWGGAYGMRRRDRRATA